MSDIAEFYIDHPWIDPANPDDLDSFLEGHRDHSGNDHGHSDDDFEHDYGAEDDGTAEPEAKRQKQ
jgi:hypothetical protein